MIFCGKIEDQSNSLNSVRFCNISVRTGDHAPFLETHGNSVRLGRSVLRHQPITTAIVTDACLNTRWHHGAHTSACLERVARYGSGRDNVRGSVGSMNAELSRPDLLATVQLGRIQA